MGLFGGGSTCSPVGHVYYLSLAYAFCGVSEEILGFGRSGTTEWRLPATLVYTADTDYEVDYFVQGDTSKAVAKITFTATLASHTVDIYSGDFVDGEGMSAYTDETLTIPVGTPATLSTYTPAPIASGSAFVGKTGVRPDPVPSNYPVSLETCPITYYDGTQASANSILQAHTGSSVSYSGTTYAVIGDRTATLAPTIVNKLALQTVTSTSGDHGAFIGLGVTTVPHYKMKLRRTTVSPVLGASRINDDVNPAHIIYDILVTHLELSPSSIDTAAFQTAATTLISEGIGLSLAMTISKKASDWIDEVLRHIDGVLYYDINISKYTLKLLRDDYNIGTIPVVSEANSFDVVVERKSWADTFNTFTFKYTDRNAKSPTTLVVVNTANKKTVGQIKSKTIEYMAVTEAETMEIIANRAVKKLSYPLASVKFKVSTIDFPTIQVGDVINLTHTTLGVVDVPVRVLTLGGDKEDSTIIEIEGTEDIYGVAKATSYVAQGNLSTGANWSVGPIVHAEVLDLPGELYTEGTILPVAAAPTGVASYITCQEVNDDVELNEVNIDAYHRGTLDGALSGTGQEYTLANINFTSTTPMNESVFTDTEWQAGKHGAIIGNELIFYQDLLDNGSDSYTLTNVIRGAYGSVIEAHSASDNIWIPSGEYNALTVTTASQNIKFFGANAKEDGSSLTVPHTYTQTGFTPYVPSNVVGDKVTNDITITWNPAMRQHGATYYIATNIAAGLEEGLQEGSWSVTWDTGAEIVSTPIFTITEASVKTYTIKSVLNGIESAGVDIII